MKAELIPIGGGVPIPITRDITVVGRREFCDVQVDDPSLSKRHCVLVKTDGLLLIRDLATTNGTKVKGQLVRWAALLPNDLITLGKRKFRVFLGPDEAVVPADAAQVRPSPRPGPVAASPPASPAPTPARVASRGDEDMGWFDRLAPGDLSEAVLDLE